MSTARELEESQRQLDETQAIAHIGSWSWDRATDTVEFSDELYRIYGLEPQSVHVDLETYIGLIVEEDRQAMRDAVARCARHGESVPRHPSDPPSRRLDRAGSRAAAGPSAPAASSSAWSGPATT